MLKKLILPLLILSSFCAIGQNCDVLNNLQIPDSIEICNYDTLRLSTDPALRYEWGDLSTNPFFRVQTEGKLHVEISLEGCESRVDTIEILFFPTPIINKMYVDTTLCFGDTLFLQSRDASNIDTFLWEMKQAPSSLAQSVFRDSTLQVIFDEQKNSQNVYLYIINLYGYCQHPLNLRNYRIADTAFVFFANPPNVDLGNDTTLCDGEEDFVLSALSNDFLASKYEFQWKDGNGSSSSDTAINVNSENKGLQTVTLRSLCGDSDTDSITIDFWPKEWTESKLIPDTSVCEKIRVTLDATALLPNESTKYLWLHDSSTNPIIVVSTPRAYEVILTDSAGCQRKFSSNVKEDDCTAKIEMPNIFTPDGDFINDLFKPTLLERVYNFEMWIYNRWGRAVFKYDGNPEECAWDGNNGNTPSPEGVYFWVVKYTDVFDKKFAQRGTVTVLRSR